MPHGSRIRSCKNTSNRFPLTTSTIRPSVLIPELLYCQRVPGSKFSGTFEYDITNSARVLSFLGEDTFGWPEVCVSRSRIVIGREGFFKTRRSFARSLTIHFPLNSGRCFSTASSTDSFPSSCSIRMHTPANGLVMLAIQNK